MDTQGLIRKALQARDIAYAPYSNFTVGAALLTDTGKLYLGGNIENATYGATNCAERTAFFKAISEGERKFAAIAVAGGEAFKEPTDYAYPCGICRQVMLEFCKPDFQVYIVKSPVDYKCYSLQELLPYAFSKESL